LAATRTQRAEAAGAAACGEEVQTGGGRKGWRGRGRTEYGAEERGGVLSKALRSLASASTRRFYAQGRHGGARRDD